MRIDLSESKLSGIEYSGADEKLGIVFRGERYLVKFQRKNLWGQEYNDVSEYICSKIFNMLGIRTQDTFLVVLNGRKAVACKDFCYPNIIFKPFSDVGDSSLDVREYKYSFDDIKRLIYDSNRFSESYRQIVIDAFWDTYVVDALLANGDRHGKNWGFLKVKNFYRVAPIFDNGNSLFSGLNDKEEIESILSSKEEMDDRVFNRPRSLIRLDGVISDYYSVISSKKFVDCNNAILRIVRRINLAKINSVIDSIDEEDLPSYRKTFLKKVIQLRYEKILLNTYRDLTL